MVKRILSLVRSRSDSSLRNQETRFEVGTIGDLTGAVPSKISCRALIRY